MFGFEQRSHSDFPLARFTQTLLNVDQDLQKNRQDSRDSAHKASDTLREYNKEYFDKRHKKSTKYNKGDYVLVRDMRLKPGENSKLKAQYKGPYLVAKSLGNSRYVIKDIPGFNQTSRPMDTILSADKIKPWIKPIG